MKIVSERIVAIQTHNNQGQVIEVKGVKKVIIHLASGKQVWATPEQVDKTANEATYTIHEKGDKFTATRDSSRTFTEGENKGNPLYLKGEVVERNQESLEFLSATTAEVFSPAMKEKMEFAAKLGLSVKI